MSKKMHCPYNPSHEFDEEKLVWHVTKCSKTHRNIKELQCPYISTHFIIAGEYLNHITRECEGKPNEEQIRMIMDYNEKKGHQMAHKKRPGEEGYIQKDKRNNEYKRHEVQTRGNYDKNRGFNKKNNEHREEKKIGIEAEPEKNLNEDIAGIKSEAKGGREGFVLKKIKAITKEEKEKEEKEKEEKQKEENEKVKEEREQECKNQ